MGISSIIGGIVIIYLIGVPWMSFVTGMGIKKALLAGALPFIPGDLLKAAAAVLIAKRINKYLNKGKTV